MNNNMGLVYSLEKNDKCSNGKKHNLVYTEHNCIPDTSIEVIVYKCKKCNNKFFTETPEQQKSN